MKALDFLKMIQSDGLLDGKCVIYSDFHREAISELEALQQHIKNLESQLSSNPLQLTCDDRCVYWTLGGGCSGNFLVKCNGSNILADKFKQKDTK